MAHVKVGLRFKAACRGKQTEDFNTSSDKVKAIRFELDITNFQNNFKVVVGTHGRSVSGFEDGTNMRLFVHSDLVKSDTAHFFRADIFKNASQRKA